MLKINGYTISSDIPDLKALTRVMMERGVYTKTKSQAKAVLRIARYLGVRQLSHYTSPDVLEMNVPSKAEAEKVYKVDFFNGKPTMRVEMSVGCQLYNLPLDYDDVVDSKTIGAWLQDL